MPPQLREIVYAKWDETTLWYLAEIKSMDVSNKTYSVDFMDGYSSENVVHTKIRKVPTRERNNPMIDKTFFDAGDYVPGKRKTAENFKEGEFKVLAYQPGKNPTYWCERQTNNTEGKRDLQEYFCKEVVKLVDKYEKE